jgi:hypothetical protein
MSNGKKLPRQDGSASHVKESRAASRRGTGPRTLIGKTRSKYNAIKLGLFAKAVLLNHESQSQFDALLRGLEQDYMPVGMSDKIDVAKLAADYWRYHRLLKIETSEMQKNIEQVEAKRSDRDRTIHAAAEEHFAKTNRIGVLCEIEDYPEDLQTYGERLGLVKTFVEMYGFERSYATDLGFLYGARYSGRPGRDLFDIYLECLGAFKATAVEREKKGFTSEMDCVRRFVDATEKEIRRLERLWNKDGARQRSSREPKRNDTALPACEVLDSSAFDALLRYQTSLERSIERTLTRLERSQQRRLGQPVLPKL